jgi:activator of HSP90 ATPase
MSKAFEVSALIPVSPDVLYDAWLDSSKHSEMTGAPAHVSDLQGGNFDAWDGYIQGKNLELELPNRIVQSWRTVEFDEGEQDSLLEIKFEDHPEGTLITIRHSRLPDHGDQYKQGWVDNYFEPMQTYFGS